MIHLKSFIPWTIHCYVTRPSIFTKSDVYVWLSPHCTTPTAFSDFFTTVERVHKYNTILSSQKSYFTSSVRTNHGKFSLRYKEPITGKRYGPWVQRNLLTSIIQTKNFKEQLIRTIRQISYTNVFASSYPILPSPNFNILYNIFSVN